MIHSSAIVDPGAKLAADVEVGPYSVIGAGVEIGAGTIIGPHVVIMGPSKIGRENRIFQFASIGDAPQDKKYQGEPTSLELGDRNVIREYVTLNRGTDEGNGKTTIGDDNLFMAYSHVAHDCRVGNHTVFANAASLSGHVEVGDYVILGGFTSVHQFTQIGSRAFCGLGSVVTQDIPPFSTAAGNRARVVGINKEGLRRRGFSADLIRALHKSFRELLKSKASRQDAFENLRPLCEKYPEVEEFVNFVRNSKRGIAS
ncbi:MAG: acyl-ACP--UDP-N-acetylglucosamine O-acyltransferase [Gammaproteobacteria bacterium]|nr:acyl-ACP--UDP-N-acetylglucosamine O-acyltransferase [Gammaproteobacteria bacterium]MDH3446750.1 acyl-ACP--UDP-N-acetylglucosamine O-acyltransferase [Gammaproteobacteria bacterium]